MSRSDPPDPMEASKTPKPSRPGSQRARGPVFLERASYRQRRLVDAVRLLPVLGVCLWAVPMLWSRAGPRAPGPEMSGTYTSTSDAILYLFGLWLVLVVVAAVLARGLARADPARDGGAPAQRSTPGTATRHGGGGHR